MFQTIYYDYQMLKVAKKLIDSSFPSFVAQFPIIPSKDAQLLQKIQVQSLDKAKDKLVEKYRHLTLGHPY